MKVPDEMRTAVEVKDILADALKAVTEAGIPDDLREVAFAKAVDLVGGNGGPRTPQPGSEHAAPAGERTTRRGGAAGDESLLGRMASKLGVDRDAVEAVFAETDGDIEIVVNHGKLAKGKFPAAQELALLLAAGRQAAELEERTSLEDIRAVCEDFKKLDQHNFNKAMNQMADEFTVQGKGKERGLRVTRPGWTKAAELVERLGGGAA